MRRSRFHPFGLFFILPFWIFSACVLNAVTFAGQNSFRKEFIEKSAASKPDALDALVRDNKDIVLEEVNTVIAEALDEGKKTGERIELLQVALKIATAYYRVYGGDKKVIRDLNRLLLPEMDKQKKKMEEERKWEKVEQTFLGNFVMRGKKQQMEEQGLAPVVYPHWIHRILYKCKVCHEGIFIKKRRANNINQADILEGKQCGVCHNGATAFGANRQCERCHMAGSPESAPLFDIKNVDHQRLKQMASQVGAEWNAHFLSEKKVPLDRFNYIDWIKLREMKVINPVSSLQNEYKEEIRNNTIFFEAKSDYVMDVLFDHGVHTWWVNCSTCHPTIFIDKLGANNVRMVDMQKGEFCGSCHSKVAFTFANCTWCHKQEKGVPPEGALMRSKPPASENKAGLP